MDSKAEKALDRKVSRFLLKPLNQRTQVSPAVLSDALKRFDLRFVATSRIKTALKAVFDEKGKPLKGGYTNPEHGRHYIELVQVLYLARRLSKASYVYMSCLPAETLHEHRIMKNQYADMVAINNVLDEVKKKYGISPDEHWARGEGPRENRELNDKYDMASNKHFAETFRELGAADLAQLHENNREEFMALRERGRRALHHKNDLKHALKDSIIRHEITARRAAKAGAYFAAVIALGAGVEGILLLRCLSSKAKATKIAMELPNRMRPRDPGDPTRWTFEVLTEVSERAGWFRIIVTKYANYNPAGLAGMLREMRNYVHPGREARERPWVEVDEVDYMDAQAVYDVLFSIFLKPYFEFVKSNEQLEEEK